jgi:PAS domain S-box-containing protein
MTMDAVLRSILETVLDAALVMDRSGSIQDWNSHCETLFGWTAEEAIGQNLADLIVPPAYRRAHSAGLERFNATGTARVLDQRLELSALHRSGIEIPIELSITLTKRDGEESFIGFLRDISQRRLAEEQAAYQLRESKVMLELSELANRDVTFEQALAQTVDAICELTGWPVGHAFVLSADGTTLESSAWSRGARKRAQALVKVTKSMRFARGVGLPGLVLEQNQPVWIPDVSSDPQFLRKGKGFEAAFAFPVLSGGRCIAVLEFFSDSPREPKEALRRSVQVIGAQVGRVFERKRAEELRELLLGELNHRAKNILAVVRGMAHLSFGTATDLAQARKAFDERLDAIGKANTILHEQSGDSALLGDVVREALSGCGSSEERLSCSGPAVRIGSSTAIVVSLAIHELCTNAFKYGALSGDDGLVELSWDFEEESDSRFWLNWSESGGPEVVRPEWSGFGSRILIRAMERETGGEARIDYAPSGLKYRLTGARHLGGERLHAEAA